MVEVKEISRNVLLIDSLLYSIPHWGSVYLLNEGKKALIDSAAATSAGTILEGVKQAGLRPEDIDYIIPTHIHLDHAGGAGALLRSMPRARVVVHHLGAKHLVDPTRLWKSMVEAQGPVAAAKHGEVVPVDASRVHSVHEGDVIKLGEGQILQFMEAPGHAPHELCIRESRNNGVFVGDAVGLRVAGDREYLFRVTPPPSFDMDAGIRTIERLMALKPSLLYFAHFGATTNVQKILQTSIDNLTTWGELVAKAMAENGAEGAKEVMLAKAREELEPIKELKAIHRHILEVIVPMNVTAYINYYQKKQASA